MIGDCAKSSVDFLNQDPIHGADRIDNNDINGEKCGALGDDGEEITPSAR